MKKNKMIAMLLALAMVFSLLAGCGVPAADDTPAKNTPAAPTGEIEFSDTKADEGSEAYVGGGGGHLIVGVANDIGSMWPGGTPTSGKRTMRALVYQTLFNQDENGEFLPAIGKSYEYLGDGKYSVEIFDYIYDTAGNHVTAEDVIFSLGLHVADGSSELVASTLTEYEATGKYTLEFKFEPIKLGHLQQICELPIITKAAWDASGDDMSTNPVGTGPYVMTESTMGSSYKFERVDNHWQTDEEYINQFTRYPLDGFTIVTITDTSALAIALQSGQIDFSPDIAAADLRNFSENGVGINGYTLTVGDEWAMPRIVYNCGENSPCQDVNLRKAIAHAIDAASCAYAVHGSFGKVVNMAANPGLQDAPDEGSENYFPYDVELAKEYLKKSSYQGETLKMLVQPNKNIRPAATLIQQYLAEIGVKVELLNFEYAQYKVLQWEGTGKEFDLHIQGVSGSDQFVAECVQELDINTTPEDDINRVYIHDEQLQALYDVCSNPETYSKDASKALLDYVEENCYLYGLYYGARVSVGRDYVKGIFSSPTSGQAVYTSAYIEK